MLRKIAVLIMILFYIDLLVVALLYKKSIDGRKGLYDEENE